MEKQIHTLTIGGPRVMLLYSGYHGYPCKQSSAAHINSILLGVIRR